jgi:cytochrome c
LSDNPDYQKGLALVGKSDCLTCHKVDEKNIGPSYRDVAAKYENTDENVKMLAGKIIKGGSGVWGAIPMTPHPALSQEDAEALAKYVLLLKK